MKEVDLVRIFNRLPFGISELTPLEGNYVFFNEKERILRKLSFSEMQSVSIFKLFCEEESQKLKMVFKKCAASHSSTVQKYFFKYKNDQNTFQMMLAKSDNGNIISLLTDITHLHQLVCFGSVLVLGVEAIGYVFFLDSPVLQLFRFLLV